jgi:hypothetical protein
VKPHLLTWQERSAGCDKIIKELTTSNVSFYRSSESKISGDNKCKLPVASSFRFYFCIHNLKI